jgi:3',5'-cyclic AMP phosphodiesterase CpdA
MQDMTSTTRDAAGTDLIAPLVLLQLSDLHFGPHSRFVASELPALAAHCRRSLDQARADLGWQEAIGLVLVTGDVAEAARPPQYREAASFFTALARELALPSRCFVFVPGNHDVSWTQCRNVEAQLDDEEFPASELRSRLDAVKFAHFERFVRDFHGGKAQHEVEGSAVSVLPRGAFLHDFPELGVSIAALNSCERESHRKEDHVGSISTEQAQAILDHWLGAPAGRIRIAAVHHNPSSMASAAIQHWLAFLREPDVSAHLTPELVERFASNLVGFEGRDVLRTMASDAYVSLLLHGHHHASVQDQAFSWRGRDAGGRGDTRILSAGSWGLTAESGKLPKDQPTVMQLVRIDPATAQVRPALLRWEPNARLPGTVHRGGFLLDAESRAERPIGLSLPPSLRGRFRAPSPVGEPSARPRLSSDAAAVIERYRQRKSGWSERVDLRGAGPTPVTGNRPTEITLDEMYVPLSFLPELDSTDLEGLIRPDDLLEMRRPQVIIGAAGAGKTTWMKWTFRRLIEDLRAVPVMLQLGAIAATENVARSIESYLVDALSGCGASDPGAIVRELLADPSGLRLVVLIDGWDELGVQGDALREHLVEFCRAFPHVAVMVSSRPYGESRPAAAEDFETVYIMPLGDSDIRLLVERFYRRVHGHDERASARATEEFIAALSAAPGARSLAGTALLLTMMLLLSGEGPLPDRPHELYTACLRNMLLHRALQREQGGALTHDQWRPDNPQERLRVVAELAFGMQTAGYAQSSRVPMVCAWDDAVRLLGNHWAPELREKFLRWLVASAGVLLDRADRSVYFAHLSFQEHLAAYYLHITVEGDGRIDVVRAHMGNRNWWETLRLWAGLTADHGPGKLTRALAALRADVDAYWLAGQIFADGIGEPSAFDIWVAELPLRLSDPSASVKDCASTWAACKQPERRRRIAATLAAMRTSLHWFAGALHAQWSNLAKLEVDLAPALLALEGPLGGPAGTARSRVLHGAAASWPDGGELAVLRLWPSPRAVTSTTLQMAISLGGGMPEAATLLEPLLARVGEPWPADVHARVIGLVQYLHHYIDRHSEAYFDREFALHFARDFIRDLARCVGQDFVRDFFEGFAEDFGRYFVRALLGYFGRCFDRHPHRESTRDFARHFVQVFIQDFRQYLVLDFSRYLSISRSALAAPWLRTFALLEASSAAGRASVRAALAYGKVPADSKLLSLFRTACRASFAPTDSGLRSEVSRAAEAFHGDSLWPALARHVARISTAADRELLVELARNPEQRKPPLSWGLQCYARGDLALSDGLLVTLDSLCARIELPPLSLLDDMPGELEVPGSASAG